MQHLPRRQSAHQGVRVLGVGDRAQCSARIPDVIFLSEAFTRPKVMHRLAKLGFTQSYTYFTWRNTKHELTEYFTELRARPGARVLPPQRLAEHARHPARARCSTAGAPRSWRGSCWPPRSRPTTASTARPSSCCEHAPREPGAEEYLRLGEVRAARTGTSRAPTAWRAFIARVNRIRRDNPALQGDDSLRFLPVDNDQLIAYAKTTPDRANVDRRASSTSTRTTRSRGWVELDLDGARPRAATRPFQMHDLLTDARYLWNGRAQLREPRPAARAGARLAAAPRACAASATSTTSCERSRHRESRRTDAAGPRRVATPPRDDPLWYKDAVIYQLHVKAFFDSNDDGIGDFRGLTAEARLRPGPRRQHDLAAAVLPVAAARRRLRRRRLPQRPPAVRHARRLPALRARGAPPRPARDHRAGRQPHLRPAPVVPGRAPRAAGLAQARLLRLERRPDTLHRHAHHLHRHREVELDLGRRSPSVLLAPLLQPPARPQLRQPAGAARRCSARCASGSTWASTASGSTRSPTSSSATAPTTRTCPRRTR